MTSRAFTDARAIGAAAASLHASYEFYFGPRKAPVAQWRCQDCDVRFDFPLDQEPQRCPHCASVKVEFVA
jgi:rubrerythrin